LDVRLLTLQHSIVQKAKKHVPSTSEPEDDVLDRPADPEAPLPPEETEKFINIDDFDENEMLKKSKGKPGKLEGGETGEKKDGGSEGLAKPLNKRERAALKRAAALEAASKSTAEDSVEKKAELESDEKKVDSNPTTNNTPSSSANPAVNTPSEEKKQPTKPQTPEFAKHLPEWKPFRLQPTILQALYELGFENPTEIQKLSLNAALITTRKGNGGPSDRDIIGAAATGSGKTLAFGIPILQFLAQRDEGWLKEGKDLEEMKKETRPCTALILTPTRELAIQVTDHLKAVSKFTSAKVASIVGGISSQKQERVLSHSPDIVVATPGRLWELLSADDALVQSLRCVRYLVLDEADRMLEGGHFKELENILRAVNLKRR
jgi:ATP-dependent RNA helicase DDX24/MAK5